MNQLSPQTALIRLIQERETRNLHFIRMIHEASQQVKAMKCKDSSKHLLKMKISTLVHQRNMNLGK